MIKSHITRKYPFFILLFFFGVLAIVQVLGVTINITPSMKEGIYIRASGKIKRGDIVSACLSDPYKTIGLKNSYIQKGTKCNGADPVIKQVIAIPGDNVVLDKNYIKVNGVTFYLPTKIKDSNGKNLNTYPRGKYFNTKGYWLVGTNSANSWDSRYWGFIMESQILLKLWRII